MYVMCLVFLECAHCFSFSSLFMSSISSFFLTSPEASFINHAYA